MKTVRISDDSLSLALGADELAAAFVAAGCVVERTSSWGMHWLEPVVEIDGPDGWRGFGPATLADVGAILDGSSPLAIGPVAEHPFIKPQQRLTFARAGKTRPLSLADYAASGGWAGYLVEEVGRMPDDRQHDRHGVRQQPALCDAAALFDHI